MLEKGYAVARTRRNADRDRPGDYEAVLDNGEVWPGQNINQNPELILDMARLVRNFLKDRWGREATRIYWYGHSAGAHMGFLVNFMPEGNLEPNGKHTVDGILADDPGGGFYVPILMKNGQDVLFRTPEEKAKFVKTFSIAHQLYPNFYSVDQPWQMELATVPSYVSPSYLENKRTAARVFREKNMMSGFRMYEIKGISHSSGDTSPESGRGDVPTLPLVELSRFIDGVVDLLDNWVEKGTEPPGMRSESPGLGDKREAVNLPETACPLGVYFAYPPSQGAGSAGSTAFAPFDGVSLEPVDGRMELVDMNENGKRDKRESVTEAWHRLGLLKPDETLSRAKYVACVQNAVATLRKDNFITEKVANLYIQEAGTEELPAR